MKTKSASMKSVNKSSFSTNVKYATSFKMHRVASTVTY